MHGTNSTSTSRLDTAFARAMGLAWPLQLIVVAIWIAAPHPPDSHPLLVALITVAFAPLYVPLLVKRNPALTRTATNIAMVVGVLQMSLMVWAGGGLASGFELLPLWFVPITVCLLPRLDVVIELGTVVVGASVAAVIESHTATSSAEDPMWAFGAMLLATLLYNTAVGGYVHAQLRSVSHRFHRRSVEDELTELANRSALSSMLELRGEDGLDGTAYVIDIDGFKFINDSLGHRAGDELLKLLANRLRGHARAGDLLARTGGDEFVLIAHGVRRSEQAQQLGRRLLGVAEEPFALDGLEASISVTVGAALMHEADSVEECLSNADLALYAAQSAQRGTARLFEASMRKEAVSRLTIEHQLRRALERDELRVVYQPIVSLEHLGVTGMEALLRWRSEELGDVRPDEFIPVAERTTLIVPIGRFVLAEAVTQLAKWQRGGHDQRLSVNLSAGQLADEQLPEFLADLLAGLRVDPARVYLELTETAVMARATSRPLEMLDRLRATGVHLALDDFGTGYSSLSRLSGLNLSALKIDRSFVGRMLEDAPTSAIVSAIVRMAEPMRLSVVAEGVETPEQLAHLVALGCGYAQGYLFSRPIEADAAARLLEADRESASNAA